MFSEWQDLGIEKNFASGRYSLMAVVADAKGCRKQQLKRLTEEKIRGRVSFAIYTLKYTALS